MHRYFVASIAATGLLLACDHPSPTPGDVKGAAPTAGSRAAPNAVDASVTAVRPAEPACPSSPDFGEQFADAAQRIRPSVVSISSGGASKRENGSGLEDVSLSVLARAIPMQPAASQ